MKIEINRENGSTFWMVATILFILFIVFLTSALIFNKGYTSGQKNSIGRPMEIDQLQVGNIYEVVHQSVDVGVYPVYPTFIRISDVKRDNGLRYLEVTRSLDYGFYRFNGTNLVAMTSKPLEKMQRTHPIEENDLPTPDEKK